MNIHADNDRGRAIADARPFRFGAAARATSATPPSPGRTCCGSGPPSRCRTPHRRTSTSPACGPVPVTTVPVTIANAVSTPTAMASRRSVPKARRRRCSSRRPARRVRRPAWTATKANAIDDIASRKWDWTSAGMQIGAHRDPADHAVRQHRDAARRSRGRPARSGRCAVAGANPERSDRHRQRRDADEAR